MTEQDSTELQCEESASYFADGFGETPPTRFVRCAEGTPRGRRSRGRSSSPTTP
jgi:hypothetical protein